MTVLNGVSAVKTVSPELAFEWVKTGHWSKTQFLSWLRTKQETDELAGWKEGFAAGTGNWDN